jgi:hypothetical protein
MSRPKTLTEQAMTRRREAYTERLCKSPPVLAPLFDRLADELLVLPGPPDVGAGGEVVRTHAAPEGRAHDVQQDRGFKRANIRDTLMTGATRIAEEASIRRTDLLVQPSFDCLALAIDTAESIDAENGLEKMLAHQLAVTHEAALRLMDRALSYEAGGRSMREGDSIEACRLANSAARLMSAFQDGIATLQRMRTGGNQTVTVQHVNVASGGQAVVGNVQTGGAKRPGSKSK